MLRIQHDWDSRIRYFGFDWPGNAAAITYKDLHRNCKDTFFYSISHTNENANSHSHSYSL
jgi:hypothetical protein